MTSIMYSPFPSRKPREAAQCKHREMESASVKSNKFVFLGRQDAASALVYSGICQGASSHWLRLQGSTDNTAGVRISSTEGGDRKSAVLREGDYRRETGCVAFPAGLYPRTVGENSGRRMSTRRRRSLCICAVHPHLRAPIRGLHHWTSSQTTLRVDRSAHRL
jgi:hypothetical protein